jgi:hypothetical protein
METDADIVSAEQIMAGSRRVHDIAEEGES